MNPVQAASDGQQPKGKSMRAHYLQHVPFEGLGSIAVWLRKHGYTITGTKFFESAALPDLEGIDLLIVMGGPMSINDEYEYPWLAREKEFIREAVLSGMPVLGVCLGAQLIAGAMGAEIYKNPVKEIGWFPIQGVPCDAPSLFCFEPDVEVFHWHGETFDLPDGATRIAKSEGCENQAFQLGASAVGLQFHLETTPESAREIVEHCREELIPSKYVQSEAEILGALPEKYAAVNALMDSLLCFITGTTG
jgi:GMP synthase-like glutamine amidotransferase